MTTNEVQNLKKILIVTAAYYGKELSDEVVRLQVGDLQDLDYDRVVRGFESFRRDPKNKFAPLPADIRALADPAESEVDVGRDTAVRLIAALAKHGADWARGYLAGGMRNFDGGGQRWLTWGEAAKAEIGEIGLAIVARYNGWSQFHSTYNYAQATSMQAQLRDLASSIAKATDRGAAASTSLPAPARPARAYLYSGFAEKAEKEDEPAISVS